MKISSWEMYIWDLWHHLSFIFLYIKGHQIMQLDGHPHKYYDIFLKNG